MESINQLLDTCSSAEKTQLIEFAKIKNPPSSKKLMLMKLFVSQPNLSDSEYAQKIYKKPEGAAYFQLKKRVKDEFEELLLLLKPTCINKENQLHIGCSELLLKSQLILARGIRSEGSKLLERGLKMAIKHGFHDLVLTIYSTAVRFEIYEVLNNNDLPELEIAIKSHLQLLIKKNYKKSEEQKHSKNQHLKTMISQLNYSRNSWFILDDINRSIQYKEYENALSQVNDAESDWNYTTESRTKDELVIAKMSILLAKRDFTKLLEECIDSVDTSNFSRENELRHSLNHWHALFHLNKTEEAQQILRKNLMKLDSSQLPKWSYLEAFIHFKQRNLKTALKQIHAYQKYLKCIPEYYLGSKMLELMILFDQNDQDWLEYKIENFRKLISRYKCKTYGRIYLAFQLFSKLQKSLFKPGQFDLIQDPSLIELQNEVDGLEWKPNTSELIRYDSWIITSIKRQYF
ncbi:hypothetical protein SYJ56_00410 [Algoriphagus sp. D3-2-R+10]|uniref:hypothetical protein n=1 Tax=Algoriphagus aurantiacus TaxID=3103948 RepID=UPI002B3EB838|nr:hypothetical protein [Algoriphagus sp. D3-2-R+10]MEB2773745.1 hypothetical protein [Algoriphagus sp. D3-2-R+10]